MIKKFLIEQNKTMQTAVNSGYVPYQQTINYEEKVLLLECLGPDGTVQFLICDLPDFILDEKIAEEGEYKPAEAVIKEIEYEDITEEEETI